MPLPYGIPPGAAMGMAPPPVAPRPMSARPGARDAGEQLIEAAKMLMRVAKDHDHLKRSLNPIVDALTRVIGNLNRERRGPLPPVLAGGPRGALNVTPAGGEVSPAVADAVRSLV